MPVLKLKTPERLWCLDGSAQRPDGGHDIWWPVNNPPWRLYEAGALFTVVGEYRPTEPDCVVTMQDEQGRYAGWDIDECSADRSVFLDLFEVCPVPCNETPVRYMDTSGGVPE